MTKISLHKGDLPSGLSWGSSIAIDTETLGLSLIRDKLCVVQISAGDGTAHVVQMDRKTYHAPNLKALLADRSVEKIFHFARFDLAMIKKWLDVDCTPVFCTKIGSKLARTYTDRHGLKDVSRELAGVDMSKAQQSSDWGAETLTDAQLAYAASDVLHLHKIRDTLTAMLEREGRYQLARDCFDFLPTRAQLDLEGWAETDIFAHS
ncbi:MAG: ribonuclease D [Ponticaulis sp.]|nr:ribonuclease D [Ponticaulis sp.]